MLDVTSGARGVSAERTRDPEERFLDGRNFARMVFDDGVEEIAFDGRQRTADGGDGRRPAVAVEGEARVQGGDGREQLPVLILETGCGIGECLGVSTDVPGDARGKAFRFSRVVFRHPFHRPHNKGFGGRMDGRRVRCGAVTASAWID